jgi:hypothetical protein
MKRNLSVLAVLLAFALPAVAHESHEAAGTKTKSVQGEVVDMGCWLGHSARGEGHVSCATKCLAQGMPAGILTSNGTLYLVTLDHDNADPYNSLKTMAGKQVVITGAVLERSGMKAIEATQVRIAGK